MDSAHLTRPGKDYTACTGCSLCYLVCPAWRHARTPKVTAEWMCKTYQAEGGALDLAELAESCSLCGACEAACPEGIALMDRLTPLVSASPLVGGNGIETPGTKLAHPRRIRDALKPTDFYVISARPYHADQASRVLYYDTLQRETGVTLNLDLQRIAIPVRHATPAHPEGSPAQVEWLLRGRRFERIVAEDAGDAELLKRHVKLPVVTLAALMEGQAE